MVLPTVTGVFLTGSSWMESFLICYVIKHVLVSQLSSLLNSAAHLFGDKPYNTKIMACDDKVLASFTVGEGYHKLVFTRFFFFFIFFWIFSEFFLYFFLHFSSFSQLSPRIPIGLFNGWIWILFHPNLFHWCHGMDWTSVWFEENIRSCDWVNERKCKKNESTINIESS